MNFLAYENGITMGEALNVSLTGIIVVMIILALLAVLVILLSKSVRSIVKSDKKPDLKNDEAPAPVINDVQVTVNKDGDALPDNQSAGILDLYKTDEKTAAVIMAIISNESGIPLNKLQFNSIKLIEE